MITILKGIDIGVLLGATALGIATMVDVAFGQVPAVCR